MANFLNDYRQDVITTSDYVKLLRQYTKQHYLPNGKINLVENYDPNLGGPIVYFYWSNHYLHSSYNNLVISGLCGVRPAAGDTLEINPLIDKSINYFYLDDLRYHGHSVSIVYDADGTRYNMGAGLMVYVDDKKVNLINSMGINYVVIGSPVKTKTEKTARNLALNIAKKDFPRPDASVNTIPDSIFQAIDGRIWYFPEISNRWTTEGSNSNTDWYAIDFGAMVDVSNVKLYFYEDGKKFGVPDEVTIEYQVNDEWVPLVQKDVNRNMIGNTLNTIEFEKTGMRKIRINFRHEGKDVALTEVEIG
jgi:hypothetical protein